MNGRGITHLATCEKCGGLCAEQKTPMLEKFTGVWLHMHQADWIDAPHNAVPKEARAITAGLNGERVETPYDVNT